MLAADSLLSIFLTVSGAPLGIIVFAVELVTAVFCYRLFCRRMLLTLAAPWDCGAQRTLLRMTLLCICTPLSILFNLLSILTKT